VKRTLLEKCNSEKEMLFIDCGMLYKTLKTAKAPSRKGSLSYSGKPSTAVCTGNTSLLQRLSPVNYHTAQWCQVREGSCAE
jgi:hypothetical protein